MPQKCKWCLYVRVHEKKLPGELDKYVLKRISVWGKCGHLKQQWYSFEEDKSKTSVEHN